jgi:RNA polymerase sigma-70 factor, ECF subfamily
MSALAPDKVQPTDEKLIELYFQGDEAALEYLINRYLKPIYSFVHRCLAGSPDSADITQEAFIKAWKSLKRFDPSRKFRPWMYRIARNASLDHLKKKKLVFFADLDDAGEETTAETIPDDRPLPDETTEATLSAEFVEAALGRLSYRQRTVLVLKADGGLTFEEMSEILEEPMNTVKSRYRRALLALRQELDKK